MADHFAAFSMPDTDLTRKAYDLVFTAEAPAFAHHSVRSYVFARAVAEARGLAPGSGFDDEVLFLACVLHDIGLSEMGDGDQRFEVDGADVAAAFLRENGMDADRVQTVWTAIALHTSRGIAERMSGEVGLAHLGIGLDVIGPIGLQLPDGLADEVHAAWPRLETGCGLEAAIVGQVARNPRKAPMGSLPYELARQAGVDMPMPTWTEMVTNAWPGVA